MPDKEVLLTSEGLEKLEKELEHLKTVARREVAEHIKLALEFGDISENSEYEDAKNEQAFIEGRIATIEKTLRNARVIDESTMKKDLVGLGSRVKLKDLETGEVFEYTLVGSAESDPVHDKISNEAPVGRTIMGKKAGTVVDVVTPAGVLKYEIMEVSRH
jgi:transcription elongation factor GreA